jgi:hypothetical protein
VQDPRSYDEACKTWIGDVKPRVDESNVSLRFYGPGGFGVLETACLHSELTLSSLLFRHATASGPRLPEHSFSTSALHAFRTASTADFNSDGGSGKGGAGG